METYIYRRMSTCDVVTDPKCEYLIISGMYVYIM